MRKLSRRQFSSTVLAGAVGIAMGGNRSVALGQEATMTRKLAPGPFKPTWESLVSGYKCPDWFRDAKFGIWAHWTAQCVPEMGDWYARQMYIQGHTQNKYHVANYGHPTKFGFKDINNLWKAESWEPDKLIALYKRAGAKYFFGLANHHDNFDAYDSKHHGWNSLRIGPKRDIVGMWAKAVRENGMKFGASNHSSRAWHWFAPAYGHDVEGPLVGQRYDAATLTKEDGKDTFWEGLDPADLYGGGRELAIPDSVNNIADGKQWYIAQNQSWKENTPAVPTKFVENWFLRCQDLIDTYRPDVLYFDNTELPLGQTGLDIAAYYYNSAIQRSGNLDVVLNAKHMTDAHRGGLVEDIERGVFPDIRPAPWQTDTCIGSWHYDRSRLEQHKYKSATQVIQMLIDIVSKNGNLMLSVPLRGDGTLDEDEMKVLDGLAEWMPTHAEAIFGTRPWKTYGEGPSTATSQPAGPFGGARDVRAYVPGDIRFTTKGDTLYAFLMAWPGAEVTVTSISPEHGKVQKVELLGGGEVPFSQDARGVSVRLLGAKPNEHACCVKIFGLTL